MYFKRKIDDFLIQWKNDPAHKPLIVKGGKTGFTNEAGSCLVSYAITNKGNAYVFCTGGATYRWAPVYDEIYVYKNIIPASVKDLETETTKMSPNN